MLWIFEREPGEILRLETRYDNDTKEFVLITHRPEGAPDVERFRDVEKFRERLENLEAQLEADSWTQNGPIVLHDGWKLG